MTSEMIWQCIQSNIFLTTSRIAWRCIQLNIVLTSRQLVEAQIVVTCSLAQQLEKEERERLGLFGRNGFMCLPGRQHGFMCLLVLRPVWEKLVQQTPPPATSSFTSHNYLQNYPKDLFKLAFVL